MPNFWDYTFNDTADFVETFDELPLWSASFGLLLLKHIELKEKQTVLDIGSGTGFPLFELAERLGPSCNCYGLDPWKNASERAKKKRTQYGTGHVQVLEGSADKIPFDNESIDLVVSNLGINNFDQPDLVFGECHRVLRSTGKLALTTNLNGHWKEFYAVFEKTLHRLNKPSILGQLKSQQEHRGTVASVSALFTKNGFEINRKAEDQFDMRFLDGTAFFHHHFVKLGWLASWKAIIPEEEWELVFTALEKDLNAYAAERKGLTLTVPMLFIEGKKR
jgi:ubiquinone/menaquinone biosynthesis C-methylase UbiE